MAKNMYRTIEDESKVSVRAKKSLGQNFLMHQQTAARIADAALISKTDTVLEIGPGTGMLTRELLARAKKVIAIETDHALFEALHETFANELSNGALKLIDGDVRTFDAASISEPYLLVANIPYYITGEIIRQFLTAAHKPSSMTLLVQKEVAIRIARSKKESLLSLSVKAYGAPTLCFSVPRGAFVPAPSVDSAVLRISDIRKDAFLSADAEVWFFSILKAAFGHKRKRLAKNLEDIASKEMVTHAFESAHIGENARAEDLSLATWKILAKTLLPN